MVIGWALGRQRHSLGIRRMHHRHRDSLMARCGRSCMCPSAGNGWLYGVTMLVSLWPASFLLSMLVFLSVGAALNRQNVLCESFKGIDRATYRTCRASS